MLDKPFALDERGYAGAEKNRQLTPEQVLWARENYFAKRVGVKTLSDMFDMGAESVRRMLRGDTYKNVAKALPRARDAKEEMDLDQMAKESAERLAQTVQAKPDEPRLDALAIFEGKAPLAAPHVPQEGDEDPFGE